MDDYIIVGSFMPQIGIFVNVMKTGKENCVLAGKGDINKFLGTWITQLYAKRFKVSQPFLTD